MSCEVHGEKGKTMGWLGWTNLLVGGPAVAVGLFAYYRSLARFGIGGAESMSAGAGIAIVAAVLVGLGILNVVAFLAKRKADDEEPEAKPAKRVKGA